MANLSPCQIQIAQALILSLLKKILKNFRYENLPKKHMP
jgi:hypothetical protein